MTRKWKRGRKTEEEGIQSNEKKNKNHNSFF
jgi:hypothetical protein